MPNQSRLDAAVEAMAFEMFVIAGERDGWTPSPRQRREAQKVLRVALPHLQDQGLRELREWLSEKADELDARISSAWLEESRHEYATERDAFRAVIKEIEGRIDG